jgi:hypothetical protein
MLEERARWTPRDEMGGIVKRSAKATVRRTLRRAVTWQPKRLGDAPIQVAHLISPFRYDVLVRALFFDFLEERPVDEPAGSLVEAAWQEPYAVWFREVAMHRFRPWVLTDPQELERTFRDRVVSARALLQSYRGKGFDPASPVTLRLTTGVSVSDSGARTSRTVHVGDGGHRLALLLHDGAELAPWMYRLDPRPMPLIDNTAVLVPALGLTEDAYTRFLAAGYTGRECSSLDQLHEVVEGEGQPGLLEELHGILAVHAPALTPTGR